MRAICISLCAELHCKGRFWLETEDMFLAMADDYRVILVKLADKASGFEDSKMLRSLKNMSCKTPRIGYTTCAPYNICNSTCIQTTFFFLCLGLGGRGEPLKGKPQKKQGGIIGFSWRPERKQKTIAAETLVTWSQASVVSTILYCVVLIAQSVFPFENPTPWPSTRAPFNHGFFRRWFLLSLLTALVFGSSKPSWRICLFNTFTHWWPGWFGFFKAWEKGAYRCLDI